MPQCLGRVADFMGKADFGIIVIIGVRERNKTRYSYTENTRLYTRVGPLGVTV